MKDKKKLIIIISMALVLMTACVVGIASCSKSNKTTGEKASTEIRENKNTSTGTESSKSTENTKATVKETETQSETEVSTQAPTEVPTEAPTNASTEAIAPTNASTEAIAPTNASTEAIAPTQAPTQAPTEAPTQAKKGWGGTIYEELMVYGKNGKSRTVPKLDSELGDAILWLYGDYVETYVFHNEVAMGISKPEDIVAIYGEPRLVFVVETTAKEGYTYQVYRYRYGHYTDNLDEQIYIEFAFKREEGFILGMISAGGKTCLLEDDWKYGITGDEWR